MEDLTAKIKSYRTEQFRAANGAIAGMGISLGLFMFTSAAQNHQKESTVNTLCGLTAVAFIYGLSCGIRYLRNYISMNRKNNLYTNNQINFPSESFRKEKFNLEDYNPINPTYH